MKTFRQLILFLGLTALISGCGYTLARRNLVLQSGQTVDVKMFANRTYQPDIEAELRHAIVNELVARGEKVSSELSDFVISGEIASLSADASAFSAIDQASYYTVTVAVHAQLADRRSGKVLWKGAETIRQGYPANSNLALQRNSHVAAVSAACATAARLLVIKMNQSF